jgi:predicted ester cyclase
MQSSELKLLFNEFRKATASFDFKNVKKVSENLFRKDVKINFSYPFGAFNGVESLFTKCFLPLQQSMPDLERRDMIFMGGTTPEGQDWLSCMGNYMGTFMSPFLDIPPTGHLVHMRYHEFFQIEDGKVIQIQAIWDLPELMMQAKAWPLSPQLGAFLCTPSPMSGDGLVVSGNASDKLNHVINMLTDLCKHPSNPDPKIMNLEKYWHPQLNWYGPAGIGTARGIAGFRHWHQIPFLRGMPDRKLDDMADLQSHWFAEGNYVCETGWPNMRLTLKNDGWMGLPPTNKELKMRSLDFWRLENGLIRENWVLIDLLDIYNQLEVNVFDRLREFNKSHQMGKINLSNGMEEII